MFFENALILSFLEDVMFENFIINFKNLTLMKQIFLLFAALCLFFIAAKAQQTTISLLDPGIEPVEINQNQTSDIDLEVFFKIDHPEIGQNVYVDFGTTQGSSDVASFTAQIVPDGSGYAISYNSVSYSIATNYLAKFELTLTQQEYHDYNFITIKALDTNGTYSNTLSLGNN